MWQGQTMGLCADQHAPIHYMISRHGLSCEQVAMHLRKVGVPGSVVEQRTVCCNKSRDHCTIESGCKLTLYNTPIRTFYEKVVEPLHDRHSLNCGYVHIEGVYVGCVNNLFRESACGPSEPKCEL